MNRGETHGSGEPPWTILTAHGAVLLYLAEHPQAPVREVAAAVSITERYAARVLHDLRAAGYVYADRVGRRNTYRLDDSRPLRREVVRDRHVGDLLAGLMHGAVTGNGAESATRVRPGPAA
jgi:DNA-binding transcriptional ArsR family regulator